MRAENAKIEEIQAELARIESLKRQIETWAGITETDETGRRAVVRRESLANKLLASQVHIRYYETFLCRLRVLSRGPDAAGGGLDLEGLLGRRPAGTAVTLAWT